MKKSGITGVWAATAAATSRASSTVFTQKRKALTEDIVIPAYNTDHDPSATKVVLKPDLQATSFSEQNAYFFAKMSKIAYLPKAEAEGIVKGNATEAGMGFDRFHWFEADRAISRASILDAIHDTEAFVAANDDMIVVVFRGTQEATDWVTNLNIVTRHIPEAWGLHDQDADVHEGFDDGVNTVWGEVGMHKTIKALYNEKGKNRKLYLAGHSLGGALATVAAARLVFVDDMNITAMYTIGSPRVFDGALAAHFDAKMNYGTSLKDKYFRCRNNNDIVPRIVPLPYRHVGTEIYLDRFFLDRLLGRLSAYLRLSFIEGINDHSSSEYIRIFKQCVINSRVSMLEKTKSVVKDVAQKVIPMRATGADTQVAAIEEAKAAALEASKATHHPIGEVPEHPDDM